MKKTVLTAALAALSLNALADSTDGPMGFTPIAASAYAEVTTDPVVLNSAPWVIPAGFVQTIVSDESDLDIYEGLKGTPAEEPDDKGNDWYDMNTVNETGKQAGRFLYRTHEVRPGKKDPVTGISPDANSLRIDGGSGGAVSVVDLKTGMAKEVVGRADWEALDGIVWTPWQTVLFAEEVITSARPDPGYQPATSGLVYELKLDPKDMMSAESVTVRPMLGALSHEGIEIDDEGNVYVIDEDKKGSIYKFVPANYGDLSSGQLYALRVKNGAKTGAAEWVALDMVQAQISARVAAEAVGATPYCRPEDLEHIGHTLYAALTCEDVDNPANTSGRGAVMAIELGEKPMVKYVVAAGKNAPIEDQAAGITGFKGADNLANGPDGKLWIVEDNKFSDIWVFDPQSDDANGDGYKDGVYLFASLKDKLAEGTGIYFGKDPKTLFVNVQHSGTGNDKTMAITKVAE